MGTVPSCVKKVMYMKDWIDKLDDFLKVNEQDILTHAGKVSAELSQEHAYAEYDTIGN